MPTARPAAHARARRRLWVGAPKSRVTPLPRPKNAYASAVMPKQATRCCSLSAASQSSGIPCFTWRPGENFWPLPRVQRRAPRSLPPGHSTMGDLDRFDAALLGVASAISAGASPGENPIDTLLDCYFGFLRRKTDFFRRVRRGVAPQRCLALRLAALLLWTRPPSRPLTRLPFSSQRRRHRQLQSPRRGPQGPGQTSDAGGTGRGRRVCCPQCFPPEARAQPSVDTF